MSYSKINFSIVMPIYNGATDLENNLKRFVTACNNKKFENFFEFVITDNASSDKTKEIVYKYKKILSRNNFIHINYFRRDKNIGYPKNLISAIKISKGKYIMPLCDDSLPEKNFYEDILNFFKKNNIRGIGIVPVNSTGLYKKKLFHINRLGHVFTRGSILSGVILEKSKMSLKYIKSNLYIHNIIYINYFLKYGLSEINLKSKIKVDLSKQSVIDKFDDRMGRKIDFGVLDKIETINIFYSKNKINFLQLLFVVMQIYTWSIETKWLINKDGHKKLSNAFFKKILEYKNKKIIFFSFILILIRNIFSKKIIFILNSFLILIFNDKS